MAALTRLSAGVKQLLGPAAAKAFLLITALQFHLPFYAGRTLPNVIALVAASLAHADWLTGRRPARAIILLAFTVVRSTWLSLAVMSADLRPHTNYCILPLHSQAWDHCRMIVAVVI